MGQCKSAPRTLYIGYRKAQLKKTRDRVSLRKETLKNRKEDFRSKVLKKDFRSKALKSKEERSRVNEEINKDKKQ
jgi:hypothetical protein